MNVSENLYDYLKHNDKAELIGFGTFYVKNSSAKINDLTGTIEPPKRELFFTKEQKDDKSFVAFMAKNEFISEDTAYTWIKQYSDSLNEKLSAGKSCTLGKLGKISKGLLDDYDFQPNNELNLLDDAFAFSSLKNVQVFSDDDTAEVGLLHTKKTEQAVNQNVQPEQKMPQQFADQKAEIERQIQEARQIKEENKIQETSSETDARIIEHTQATVNSDVEAPKSEEKIEELNVDATPTEDKTQETVERAAQFKEKVVVEDIKPAENIEQAKSENEDTDITEDELERKAKEILKRHSKSDKKNKIKQPRQKRVHIRIWFVLFCIVLFLLVVCSAFVGAHWMGWLKDVKSLKPVTDKLSYYIPVRKAKEVKVEKPLAKFQVETMTEESYTGEIEYQEPEQPTMPFATTNNNKAKLKKAANDKLKKVKQEKHETVKPVTQIKQEPEIVDNTPVLTQNYSKLGFDVVAGQYADKAKAEKAARKAKRLGYDGYVLSKIKSGTPVYYVSYGSRRTLNEANDLMQSMQNRLGGSYYVISR